MTYPTILFRGRGDGRLAASVHMADGVFDLERLANGWRCSCGRSACDHLDALRLTLTPSDPT